MWRRINGTSQRRLRQIWCIFRRAPALLELWKTFWDFLTIFLNLYRKVCRNLGQMYAVFRIHTHCCSLWTQFETHCCPPKFACSYLMDWGTRWNSWLGHCVTSRKVAGSVSYGVTRIFHWHNPSGRTVSTRNTSWGGGGGRNPPSWRV